MNILFLDSKTIGDDISLDIFKQFGNFISYETTLTKENTLKRTKNANIIITNKVVIDKDIIDNATDLKLICVAATGMNNIDLEYAKKRDIEVRNVANYSTKSVAQHTFTLLFYLLGQTKYYDDFVKERRWCESKIFTHLKKPFWEIFDKTWGIIGLGSIGKEVAKIAECFGANILYYSTSGKNINSSYKKVTLEELLKTSDIISIHAPLNNNTNNLLTKKELLKVKDGSIILNLGRGAIINEDDLAEVIDEKEIYVGLDVTKREPLQKDSPLFSIKKKNNLVITPHIAWSSIEARNRLVHKIAKNIENYLKER